MRQITLKAFAKINLSLKVLDHRPDGFHNIDSVMQSVSLHDLISLELMPRGIHINCNSSDIPLGRENTAYRAAEEFIQQWHKKAKIAAGQESGIKISIEKNIPIGAGLAGGSADAAAVIAGLNILLSAQFSLAELQALGLKIGSDVPFCLVGGGMVIQGRGEILSPAPRLGEQWLLLVNPGFEVATKWAYAEIDRQRVEAIKKIDMNNDFEALVIDRHPEVAEMQEVLRKYGASQTQMSGSGPTVFGFFENKDRAEQAFEEIILLYPRTYIASFVPRGLEII